MSTQHIVILHGWSISESNEEKWTPFISLLKQNGCEVTFLKLPGLSSSLQTPWTVEDYVNWINEQLQTIPIPVVLLGHSFGGQLAIRYSVTYPDRIASLVLIDSAGIRDTAFKAVVKRTVFAWVAKIGKQFVSNDFFRKLLHKLARETDYYKADTVMRETMSNVLDDEVLADLPNVNVPTLILWGKSDMVTPVYLAQKFNSGIHGSQLHFIDEARHSPQFTHVDEVVQSIDIFLKSM